MSSMIDKLDTLVETRDVAHRWVLIAGASLLALLIFGAALCWLIYKNRLQFHDQTASQYSTNAFPLPRLQTEPADDLRDLHEREEARLTHYAWKNQARTRAVIPIDRVIDLAASKHLIREEPGAKESHEALE